MTQRIIKAPQGLAASPFNQKVLKLKGLTVIESCTNTVGKQGSMFLEDYLLMVVLNGTYTVRYGDQVYIAHKHEMVLLQKSIVIEYEKSGEPNQAYLLEYMMFFLKDELLKDFIKMADIQSVQPTALVPIFVNPISERLLTYLGSLKPYFNEPDNIEDGLIKIKLLELLFDLSHANGNIMQQLLQLKQPVRSDISTVVEQNILNPVSVNDLAYLSGRSLSSFKRDFQTIYNTSPSLWIRQKRLEKARELLTHSAMSVTDVCFTTGFENVAHFSRVFKEHFGYTPSFYKQQLS
ncbi:helix-turn-helix domain-containing protein [Paenibacillus sp. Soil724D2]|uniref:helix-turn-helix domain-containing protein n=1 Tax=Paenibacillus sp. (strain Soil724D2) TaxID=1736392 RepID=UPI00071324FB|nr:AraC family transcriptional regulator [Paenibacillus sp. Soil724D2]KRE35002.1 AraC family transcriptional regulator [Paenibacillus sp. Soil724D2]